MGKSKDQKADTSPEAKPESKAGEAAEASGGEKKQDVPEIEPPPPKGEPWPDATPEPMRPVEPTKAGPAKAEPTKAAGGKAERAHSDTSEPRAHNETVLMPMSALQDDLGAPPEMPEAQAPPVAASAGAVEDPTHMPGPREIPGGTPDDPASPPGLVPRGDSRSLRRGREFALVYRQGTFVISRFGVIGTRGQWRVVEYPTSASAANAYAREASRFVSDGFLDYRE